MPGRIPLSKTRPDDPQSLRFLLLEKVSARIRPQISHGKSCRKERTVALKVTTIAQLTPNQIIFVLKTIPSDSGGLERGVINPFESLLVGRKRPISEEKWHFGNRIFIVFRFSPVNTVLVNVWDFLTKKGCSLESHVSL